MSERFIVDDCGTLIDMVTRDTFDYVSDVVGLLNGYDKENEQLKQDLEEYCNFSLHDLLDKKNKENEELKADKQSLIDFIKKEFPKSHKHILEGFE